MTIFEDMITDCTTTDMLGSVGECIAKWILEQGGYAVRCITGESKCGDLLVNDSIRIEVKTSTQSKYGRWNFQLFKCDKYGSTNHLNSDYIMLLCITESFEIFSYLLPTKILRSKSKTAVTSHPTKYRGYLAQYRVKSNQFALAG